jgi:Arc/MetJ-type ribon-helix-helix transcriptional regulator
VTAIRLSKELRETVDKWADSQDDQPSRSEAIRRLVELGLKVKAPAKTASKPGRRLRAQELAANAIEKMIDPAAPPEESAQRRRRLTKGPSEFREDRIDLPRAKK